MINFPKVIGVSGVAGSGKNTFCTLAIKKLETLGVRATECSLASFLKIELREFCLTHYGIDPTNCTREDKETIRDLLVFHGNYKRNLSRGKHWTGKLQLKIQEDLTANRYDTFLISDIRHNEFETDEYYWLKKVMGGYLVHLSNYEVSEDLKKIFKAPANKHEAKNDPILKDLSDHAIEWPKVESLEQLNPFIDGFINFATGHTDIGV